MITNIFQNLVLDYPMEKQASVEFESKNDLLMYYHSSIRNVGMFTSFGFAALSTTRVGLSSSKNHTFFVKIFILFSFAFFLMSLRMNHILIRDIRQQTKFHKNHNDILFIPYGLYLLNLILVFVCIGMAFNLF